MRTTPSGPIRFQVRCSGHRASASVASGNACRSGIPQASFTTLANLIRRASSGVYSAGRPSAWKAFWTQRLGAPTAVANWPRERGWA